MSPEAQLLLQQWSPPINLTIILLATCLFYVRGWRKLRRNSPNLFSRSRLAYFVSGIFFLWFAIGSPLAAFDESSLTVHMIQHILLMLIVPPLVLLGIPATPLLHGLPQGFVRTTLGPSLRWPPVKSLGQFVTHPVVAWLVAAIALILWHVPAAFELALGSETWHVLEHSCFLLTSLLFWWPVVQPFPSEARWPRWAVPLYLFLGMLPGSALGAFLVFCDRVLYPSYEKTPSVFGVAPLVDQVIAGMLMWVVGFFACLVPAIGITLQLLAPRELQHARASHAPRQISSSTVR